MIAADGFLGIRKVNRHGVIVFKTSVVVNKGKSDLDRML